MSDNQSLSFEKSLSELESIVKQIDSGDMALEASLAAFEKGIALIRDCQKALTAAEQKVAMLTEGDGGFDLKPIEPKDS